MDSDLNDVARLRGDRAAVLPQTMRHEVVDVRGHMANSGVLSQRSA